LDSESTLGDDMRVDKMKVLSDLKLVKRKELSMLNQKARTNWLVHGDTNSKYFDDRIKWRRMKNDM